MIRLSCVLLGICAVSASTLENQQLKIEFDDRTGAIAAFVDKPSGRDFIRREGSGLYELTFLDAARTRVRLTEKDAKANVAVRGNKVVITSTNSERKVTVRAECTLNGAALQCSAAVKNSSPMSLFALRFPAVEFPVRLGDSAEDDRVLLPKCDGAVLENPEANLQGGNTSNYPGSASVQLLAFYDGTAGIRAMALDGAGYRKAIGVNRRGPGLSLQMNHYPELAAGKDFTVPYLVELSAFHGDWEVAASEYRKWAVKQKWARRTLAARVNELPAWLREMPFFYAVSARGQMADNKQGLRYDVIAEQAADYRKLLNAPVVAMVMSWEKEGPWVTPDYFPAVGGDGPLQALFKQVSEQGNRSLVFLSGLKWTLRKGASYDSTAAFARDGEASAMVAEDGKTMVAGKPTDDTGQYAELCPATKYASDLLAQISRHLTDLGVSAVQVDQMVGGGGPACFSNKHGHPAGGGNWQSAAVYALFARLRAEGKARSKDFAFTIEEPGELYIPVLDSYHARDYAEARWPRDGKGIRGVPLFTFIYHDYLFGYGGDSAGINDLYNAKNLYSAAANLINGKSTAAAVWSRYLPAEKVERSQRELLTASLALAKGPAHDFLLFGERLPTPKQEAPDVTHALYRLRNGKQAWIAVNYGTKPVEVANPLAASERVTLVPGKPVFKSR